MLQSFGSDAGASAASLGIGMSVALITTFYGAMLANLFFNPIAEKLKARTEDEVLSTQIAIEGLVMLQAGANPRVIERKLNSYLPPQERKNHYDRIMKRQKGI
jgi:chemotaxis protein MotA